MNIIRMSGGIGNQMFQYALYLKFISLGKEVKFDDVTEYLTDNARPIMLHVFGIEYPKASREEVEEFTDGSMLFTSRIRRKLTGRRSREYQEASVNYDEEILEKEDAYLTGCFQSERYFKDIEESVRKAYQFRNVPIPTEMKTKIEAYENLIEEHISVSIHIRRGDYLQAESVYGGICTDAYYKAAINYMLTKYPDAHFFIFTNDTAWAKEWCESRKKESENRRFTIIDGTEEATGYVDLMLMSKCKHHIIANSSFSWWGAWLNDSLDKCVAAPVKWLNTCECHDIYTPDMVRIDANGKIDFDNSGNI